MARRRTRPPLNVFVNSRLVGALTRASTGAIDFRYDRRWLDGEHAFPVSLSLPLREDRYIGAPVIAVFDNLLPDSEAIRRRVAERVGADGTDAYGLLAALGHDCVGALQFLPEGVDAGLPGAVEGQPVTEAEIGEILRNLAAAPLGMGEDTAFRISVAGAQEKTALLRHAGRWWRPTGTTATTHILKPRIGRLPNGIDLSNSVENEFFCLRLMAALGLTTAKTEMTDFGEVRTLVVERFDRSWLSDGRLIRLPQEDCCQALSTPPARKYQSEGGPGFRDLIQIFKGSDDPEADIAALIRAQVAFWLTGATDGHAKNFSLFLMPGGRFRMTPLYDVLSTEPSVTAGQIQRQQTRLAMSLGNNRHYRLDEIMPRHFEQSASIAHVDAKVVRRIFEGLVETAEARALRVIEELPAGFPAAVVTPIMGALTHRLGLMAESLTSNAP